MVGHTHEDIDQTFSCLSRLLKRCDALTMQGMTLYIALNSYLRLLFTDMEKRLIESNQSTKSAATLKYVFDIKSWISAHIEEIHQHTVPHVFSFKKNSKGKAVMMVKHWAHDDWKCIDKPILKVCTPWETLLNIMECMIIIVCVFMQ